MVSGSLLTCFLPQQESLLLKSSVDIQIHMNLYQFAGSGSNDMDPGSLKLTKIIYIFVQKNAI